MTPTLAGRWQIRLFLLGTIGLFIAVIISLLVKSTIPLFALLYVFLFGLVWDVIYQLITSVRWDRDWPTSYQVAAGIFEGAILWVVILTGKLPGIPHPPPFSIYLIEYAAIWLSIFLLTQGPLRIFSIHWRYQGGQWFMSHPRGQEDVVSQPNPASALQAAPGRNFPPQAPAGGYQQANWLPPAAQQTVRASNPYQQGQAGAPIYQAVQPSQPVQAAQPYVCACGFTYDRSAANFCPSCGKPKV